MFLCSALKQSQCKCETWPLWKTIRWNALSPFFFSVCTNVSTFTEPEKTALKTAHNAQYVFGKVAQISHAKFNSQQLSHCKTKIGQLFDLVSCNCTAHISKKCQRGLNPSTKSPWSSVCYWLHLLRTNCLPVTEVWLDQTALLNKAINNGAC